MPISLNTNMAAGTVRPHLERATQRYVQATERLASGMRINHPSDDAAGMSRSTLLEAEVRSSEAARNNAFQGLAIIQIAEGGMQQITNILMRLRELAVQGSGDTASDHERHLLNVEVSGLVEEVDRLSNSVRYAGNPLMNGQGRDYTFQIGTGNTDADRVSFSSGILDARASNLGISGVNVLDPDEAQDAIADVTAALDQVQSSRALLGATQSRFHYIMEQLDTYTNNIRNMRSGILDADMAKETTELLCATIQQRSAIAMLAQANAFPQLALKLTESV